MAVRFSFKRMLLTLLISMLCLCFLLPLAVLALLPAPQPPAPNTFARQAPAPVAPPAGLALSPPTPLPARSQSAATGTSNTSRAQQLVRPVPKDPLAAEAKIAALKTRLPPELILAVIMAESDGQPHAVSRTGAQGLMQLEPPTAHDLGVKNAFNAHENVQAGSRYLAALVSRYEAADAACRQGGVRADSDSGVGPCPSPLIEALAAYNAGPGAVARYGGVPPYPETLRYIEQVLSNFAQYSASTV